MSSQLRRLLLIAAAVAGAAGIVPAPASAGTMVHWSCGTAGRAPGNADGWTAAQRIGGGASIGESCASSGALFANYTPWNGVPTNSSGMVWGYKPAPDTLIKSVESYMGWTQPEMADYSASMNVVVYRDAESYDGAHVIDQCPVFSGCFSSPDRWRTYDFSASPAREWIVSMGCGGSEGASCAGGDRGNFRIGPSRITLTDDLPPAGSVGSGTLLDAGERSGIETLAVSASDRGVGVSDLKVTIGDKVVRDWSRLDDNGGKCVPIEGGYRWRVPCAAAVSKIVQVDTTGAPAGEQLLTVSIRDAAGNVTDIDSRRIAMIAQVGGLPPGPNGALAAPQKPGGGLATGRFSGKRKTIVRRAKQGKQLIYTGQLRDAKNTPIVGARIVVASNLRVRDAATQSFAPIVTDGEGRFRFEMTADGSRKIMLDYHPSGGSASISTRVIDARVPATLTFSAPKRAKRRSEVAIVGAVQAPAISTRGAKVRIEAYFGKRWRKAGDVRTDAAGAFRWTRKFRNRGGYRMRARLLSTNDAAASGGTSRPWRLVITR